MSQPIHVDMAFRDPARGRTSRRPSSSPAPARTSRRCRATEAACRRSSRPSCATRAPSTGSRMRGSPMRSTRRRCSPACCTRMHVGHSWLDRADAFCWKRLGETKPDDGPELAAVYCFLNNVARPSTAPCRSAEDVADAIPTAGFFALDPEDHTGEYALTPLHLAPTRDAMAAGAVRARTARRASGPPRRATARRRWLAGHVGPAQ